MADTLQRGRAEPPIPPFILQIYLFRLTGSVQRSLVAANAVPLLKQHFPSSNLGALGDSTRRANSRRRRQTLTKGDQLIQYFWRHGIVTMHCGSDRPSDLVSQFGILACPSKRFSAS